VIPLTKEQANSREKTLLVAFLLSLWAPFTTGLAVLLSRSTTQLADFIRRTAELIALFVSWQVFRYLQRVDKLNHQNRARVEKIAGLSVATALGCSGLVMFALAISRISTFEPGGNVYLGLAIALLGLVTNSWFWRRYTVMTREHYNPVTDSQIQLYRAKAFVDICVLLALSSVAINPNHVATRYIDISGSLVVSIYLVWSSYRTAIKTNNNYLAR
jgi:divalent metal cation (Fe/Co/Zn/Cd) transporter